MATYGSDNLQNRLYSALAYLSPVATLSLVSAGAIAVLGRFVPALANALTVLLYPFIWLSVIFPLWHLALFIILLIAVVRNTSISRFIRFNVLQSLLLGFVIAVIQMVVGVLGLAATPVGLVLYNIIFWAGFACAIYGIVESLRGRYTEIPKISEAIHAQLPY